MVTFLVDKGAKVNIQDTYKRTPLHMAALYDDLWAARFLVERGAGVNLADASGRTALDYLRARGASTTLLTDLSELAKKVGEAPLSEDASSIASAPPKKTSPPPEPVVAPTAKETPAVLAQGRLPSTEPARKEAVAPKQVHPRLERIPYRPKPKTNLPGLWEPSGLNQQWILCIGVSRTKNGSAPHLPYARQDAERMRDWFQSPDGPRVPPQNVQELYDEQATRVNVKRKLRWLRQSALEDDLVVVYYAGHGAPSFEARGKYVEARYLVLYDTDVSDMDSLHATGFPLDELARDLDLVQAETQVVLLECCYGGAVGDKILGRARPMGIEIVPRGPQTLGESSGRIVLTASSGRQMALSSEDRKGGLFTHYLLTYLDKGRKQLVGDCFRYVQDRVQREALRLGTQQKPRKFGDQNVDVIFSAD